MLWQKLEVKLNNEVLSVQVGLDFMSDENKNQKEKQKVFLFLW